MSKPVEMVSPDLVSGLARVLKRPPDPVSKAPIEAQASGPQQAAWRHRRGDRWGPTPGNPWNPWDPSSFAASQVAGLSDQIQGASQMLSEAMTARQSQVSWLGGLFDPAMWSMRRASWAMSSAQSATSTALSDLEGQGGWGSGGPQDAPARLSEVQGHLADADQGLYRAQVQLSQSNPYGGYDDTMYLVGNARQGVEASYQQAGYAMSMLGGGYGPEPYARSLSVRSVGAQAQTPASQPATAAAILSEVSSGGH